MINAELTRIIEETLADYMVRFTEPRQINCGNCEDFAEDVVDEYGDDERVMSLWPMDMCEGHCPWHEFECEPGQRRPITSRCSYDGHCVIAWIDNDNHCAYFDSECPQGTYDLREIPFFKRQIEFEAAHA